MIVSLVEIGVWASWTATKYVGGNFWSLISYSIWGNIPTEDEKFKALLMKKIGDLEHKNEELTAAVLAHGKVEEDSKNGQPVQKVKGVQQTISYISSEVNEEDDKKPPPTAPSLPEVPKTKINIETEVPKAQATLL